MTAEPLSCGYFGSGRESDDYKVDRNAYRQRRDDLSSSNISTIILQSIADCASILLRPDDPQIAKKLIWYVSMAQYSLYGIDFPD